ncbi:acyl-CoA-binding domain-containing protein 3-like [Juglans microcarpa x Juglans regia]|uniref:acyl-CoA-binding domain-containing protein 3-like n=1 Tax=Juglans microcarpa x Juglans regia TaxID=2249226 RepID=UPI001B7E9841|nr:acyl-CoA-binding domain-containing protein 3-like [Juglans microcarpa x Juglans regia]
MELFHLLFLTASLALLLPFLVAKFLSIAFPDDAGPPHSLSKSSPIVGERIVMEEIRSSRDRLTVPVSESVTKNVHEFLDEAPPMKVAEFEGLQVPAEEIVEIIHRCHDLPEKLSECGLQEEPDVDKFPESVGFPDKLSEENIEDSASVKEILENRVGFKSAANNDVVAESEEINRVEDCEVKETNEEKEVRFDSDEDDWEGIETTDLEKAFAAASTFVLESSSGDNEDPLAMAGVGTDLQMELYGLHRIATEGPCRDPQPMALKLFARAKWNAWQRLGRMSPEVAMEQYIKILSDKVPAWMEGEFAGGFRPEPSEAGISTVAVDLSTFSFHQPSDVDERKPEQKAGAEGGCSSGGPNSDYKAKE